MGLGDAGAPQLVGDEQQDQHAREDQRAADARDHATDAHRLEATARRGRDCGTVARLDRRSDPPVA